MFLAKTDFLAKAVLPPRWLTIFLGGGVYDVGRPMGESRQVDSIFLTEQCLIQSKKVTKAKDQYLWHAP